MTSIVIPDLEHSVLSRLHARAASHGKSVADEARDILSAVLVDQPVAVSDLVGSIRARFASIGGLELPALSREPIRPPPSFEE